MVKWLLFLVALGLLSSLGSATVVMWRPVIANVSDGFIVSYDNGVSHGLTQDSKRYASMPLDVIIISRNFIDLNSYEEMNITCLGWSGLNITDTLNYTNFVPSEGTGRRLYSFPAPPVSLGSVCIFESNTDKFVIALSMPTSGLIQPDTPMIQRQKTNKMIVDDTVELFEMGKNEIEMLWLVIQIGGFFFAFLVIPTVLILMIIYVVKRGLKVKGVK